MLLIDRTLAEHELLELFHDVDHDGSSLFCSLIHFIFDCLPLGDGFIQYKEFSDYFGSDLQSNEASIVDLTILFNDIDLNHSGEITLDDLLKFFNHQSTMISKEEGELFFDMASDVKDEPKMNLDGKSMRKLFE
jgi:Ca2+-binding EF-hand superfamily protein